MAYASYPTAPYRKLPKPLMENYEWQQKGACVDVDTELFYLPYNARGEAKRLQEAEAKAVCVTCPVREQCLEFALATEEQFGVWGGMTEDERAALLKKIKRNKLKMARVS